jgi:hypothetical protein
VIWLLGIAVSPLWALWRLFRWWGAIVAMMFTLGVVAAFLMSLQWVGVVILWAIVLVVFYAMSKSEGDG